MSRGPRSGPVQRVLSTRARAENLYRTLFQLEAQLDQLARAQEIQGHADDHDSGVQRPDGEGVLTYTERREELRTQIESAHEREPELVPLLPGIARREEGRQRRQEELAELRELKDIRALRDELLTDEEREEREQEDELEALRYETEAAEDADDDTSDDDGDEIETADRAPVAVGNGRAEKSAAERD